MIFRNYKKFSTILLLMLLILISVLFSGCKQSDYAPVSKTAFMLDTVIDITIYHSNNNTPYEEIISDAFSEISRYENLFSTKLNGSDIYTINESASVPVKVSSETIDIIKKGIYYSELSGGAFDITIGGVSSLWDFHATSPQVPSDKLIHNALSGVDYKNIIIDDENMTVQLKNAETAIDLGGIAKGYIADKIKEQLISEGVDSAIINLGGNVLAIGEKPSSDFRSKITGKTAYAPFNIGIRSPQINNNNIYTSLKVNDSSVVTSGIGERYFIADDTVYHHILDTKTGYPVKSELSGVTILSKNSVDGDALSTICFCLGEEKGRELIDSLPDVEAIFIK